MQNIPAILSEIASTSSKIEKVALIKKNKSMNMELIFSHAYNPFITFGTTKIEMDDFSFNDNRVIDERWFDAMIQMLNKLSKREYTGNRARDIIRDFMESGPEAWARLIYNILNKDLRIGASEKSINKVYDGLLPEEFVQLAHLFEEGKDEKRLKFPVYCDIKFDGLRGKVELDEKGEYVVISRNGKMYRNYITIQKELKILSDYLKKPSIMWDGEITMGSLQDILRTAQRKEDGIELAKDAVYNIFDIVDLDLKQKDRLTFILNDVKNAIEKLNLKHLNVIEGKYLNTVEEVKSFFNEALKQGLEGIMVKNLDAHYQFKKGYNWMKLKEEDTIDLEIVGFEEGKKGTKNEGKLGAFIGRLPNGGTVNVGGGIKDDEREEYWNNRKKILGDIMEVKFQKKTRDGSLQHPNFVRFRHDKRRNENV